MVGACVAAHYTSPVSIRPVCEASVVRLYRPTILPSPFFPFSVYRTAAYLSTIPQVQTQTTSQLTMLGSRASSREPSRRYLQLQEVSSPTTLPLHSREAHRCAFNDIVHASCQKQDGCEWSESGVCQHQLLLPVQLLARRNDLAKHR